MKKTKFRGFTLVELLAVIVILAIILVIAVPQIMKTIESARLGSFKSTAKLLLSQAEKQYLVDQTLNVNGEENEDTTYQGTGNGDTECGKLAKLGSDYSACKITVNKSTGVATLVTLTGTGKFTNYSCTNTTLSNVDSTCNKSGSSELGSESGQASTPTGAETLIATCTGDCLTGTPNSDGLFKDENGDYRYTGLNVNNYATFNNETWRIIGIFDGRIKLLRDAVLGTNASWYPDTNSGNAWEGSAVELGLNGDYLTSTGYLGSSIAPVKDMIDTVNWYTTAITNEQDTASAYAAEHTGNTISRKVGLIYPSDYGYASSTCKSDTLDLNAYRVSTCTSTNWMYTNMSSAFWWTISPNSGYSNYALFVRSQGDVGNSRVHLSNGVRPVVYLKSNVSISGDGKTTYYTFSLSE